MSGNTNEQRSINNGTSVGVSIGSLFGLVAGVTIFLYSQIEDVRSIIETRREYFEAKTDTIESSVNTKADKGSTTDRWTGTQQSQYQKSIEQRFGDLDKLNTAQHRNFQWQLEHQSEDLRSHGHKHSEIDHAKKH